MRETTMTTLKVKDMHCSKCVQRISNALQEENIAFKVDLSAQTVCVEEKDKENVVDILDDLGFTAE